MKVLIILGLIALIVLACAAPGLLCEIAGVGVIP